MNLDDKSEGVIPVDSDGKWLHIIGAKVRYDGKEMWVYGVWDCSGWSDGSKKYYIEIQFSSKRIYLTNTSDISERRSVTKNRRPMGWSDQAAPVGCLWLGLQILHPSPRPKMGDKVRCVCCKNRGIVSGPQSRDNEWISVRWKGGNSSDCKRAGITEVGDTLEVAYPEIG